MSLEVTGKLLVKYDTQQVSEKFKKREFVLELAEEINGNIYTNFAKMQLVQNKCDILDRFSEGSQVKVSFNIKGNKWERDGKVNYITNLDAWRVEAAGASGSQTTQNTHQPPARNNNAAPPPAYGTSPNIIQTANGPVDLNSPETIDDLPF